MVGEAPLEVVSRIKAWVDRRVRLGEAFGDVKDALAWLNEECSTARGMTLLLPCLPGLLVQTGGDDPASPAGMATVKAAAKLTDPKTPIGTLPALSRATKARIREASAIVQSVAFMRETPSRDVPMGHAELVYTGNFPDRRHIVHDRFAETFL